MSSYLNWDTKIITDFSLENIESLYDQGYVFTRVDKGVMNKTRSLRISLPDFEMSSENRRIFRKSEHIKINIHNIPYSEYSWEIAKLAKDFYDALGADFSANKVRDILTTETSNFNKLLVFENSKLKIENSRVGSAIGYAICFETQNILHYSYPFYTQDPTEPSRGLGMMMHAINYAKESGKKYIYLGSLQRPTDTYKLQFKGMEWFDGEKPASTREDGSPASNRSNRGESTRGGWQTDTTPLREILKPITNKPQPTTDN